MLPRSGSHCVWVRIRTGVRQLSTPGLDLSLDLHSVMIKHEIVFSLSTVMIPHSLGIAILLHSDQYTAVKN